MSTTGKPRKRKRANRTRWVHLCKAGNLTLTIDGEKLRVPLRKRSKLVIEVEPQESSDGEG